MLKSRDETFGKIISDPVLGEKLQKVELFVNHYLN